MTDTLTHHTPLRERSGSNHTTPKTKEQTMSNANTATVETLTAEVRTLVVGSRQITLSVAKQLDIVPLDTLQIFGRVKVNVGKDPANYVIGTSTDGTLALAAYEHPFRPERPYIGEQDLDGGKITACAREMETRTLEAEGVIFEASRKVLAACGIAGHDRYSSAQCAHWSPNGLEDLIWESLVNQTARNAADKSLNLAAAESPLIVLAGLR